MPELPEVESVKQGLNEIVKGEIVADVTVHWPRIIESPDVETFISQIKNQKIEEVKRRGKFLLFYLTEDVLISHLRMEGKYELIKPNPSGEMKPITKHTHVVFHLGSEAELRYLDVRKFGRMSLVRRGEEFEHKSLANLGPEPVREDFLFEEMQAFLKRRTKAIKSVLLDQQLVVGVGNIYADEILFHSKIHPMKPANQLTTKEQVRLHVAILHVLGEAVKHGGTTIRTYKNAFGEIGTYQDHLKMYGKKDELCVVCGTKIDKIKVAGRGTHFCPTCQPF